MTVTAAVIDQLRIYDRAIETWLASCPITVDLKTPPILFAAPDRAFAAMSRLLEPQLGKEAAARIRNHPLPFFSFSRASIRFDPSRFHGQFNSFRKIGVSADKSNTYATVFPLPYDILYRIDVWAKNRETLNVYELWSSLQFINGFETMIDADFSGVWDLYATKKVPFENGGIVDHSDVEPEEGERVLRFTQEGTLKAWFVQEFERVPAVLKINVDSYLYAGDDDISKVTGTEVDANPTVYEKIDRVVYE